MNNLINGAFIISRLLYDSEIWVMKPSEWLKIWIYLLGKVNWQDNGLFKRGEQLFKYEYITRDCRVSYDTVRRCIEHLEKANQISTKRTTRGLIISVNNYDSYQNFDSYSQSKANQKPIKSQSSTHSINEEGNKERKKEDTNTDVFNTFWSLYPKKVNKKDTAIKYSKLIGEHDSIIAGLNKYLRYWKEKQTDIQYIPSPEVFLNKRKWEDEIGIKTPIPEQSYSPYNI